VQLPLSSCNATTPSSLTVKTRPDSVMVTRFASGPPVKVSVASDRLTEAPNAPGAAQSTPVATTATAAKSVASLRPASSAGGPFLMDQELPID
jgi:hypothetical protein